MACQDIGEANPDIAGIGILLAFAVQGAIAVVLSMYSLLVGLPWQSRVRAVNLNFVIWPGVKICEHITGKPGRLHRYHGKFQKLLRFLEDPVLPRTPEGIQKRELAKEILVASSDTQSWTGIALLIAAFVQVRTNSLYQLHIIYDTVSFVAISNCAAIATTFGPFGPRHLVMIIWSCLYLGYTIAFGIRLRSWDDEKSGHCYITSSVSASGAGHPYVDNVYISVTCLVVITSLYAALGFNDASFNDASFNHTRYTARILAALERGRQQLEDLDLPFAGFAFLGVVLLAPQRPGVTPPAFTEDPDGKQITALLIALLQYPVHLYFVFALRAANDSHLTQGKIEQDWGFGQVVAIILLGTNVVMLVDGFLKYREWRRQQLQAQVPVP